jgi:bifunctional non-homologous end joining protein LigD
VIPGDIATMPVGRKAKPFDHPDWLFELKYDGFRALAVLEYGRCKLISRNGHAFASFADLATRMENALLPRTLVMDGEIVCLNKKGHPQFNELLFRRGTPIFIAFDLLFDGEHDLRHERLSDRKLELRRILGTITEPIMYADHVEHLGSALFEKACALDLEGIVAKRKSAPYIVSVEETTWFKIRNPQYSQWIGRAELFERERHREPVPGWHSCELACGSL